MRQGAPLPPSARPKDATPRRARGDYLVRPSTAARPGAARSAISPATSSIRAVTAARSDGGKDARLVNSASRSAQSFANRTGTARQWRRSASWPGRLLLDVSRGCGIDPLRSAPLGSMDFLGDVLLRLSSHCPRYRNAVPP